MHVGTTLQFSPSPVDAAPSADASSPVDAAPSADARIPADTLWNQAFATWAWRRALGPRPVELRAEPSGTRPPRLMGAHEGRTVDLGELGDAGARVDAGHRGDALRTLDLLDPGTPDWLWVEGARSVRWSIAETIDLPRVTAVVPTFRREEDATSQARAFAAMGIVGRVVVIDQGGTLAAHAPFRALQAEHPSIELLTQPNLGGSGGYARGMLASLEDPSQAVFLSDDDALISEESLRRILTLQTLAEAPTILGTGLLDASAPTRLLTHAEHVDPLPFFWRPADGLRGALELAGTTPADWDALVPRTAPDYTGWWGTLLPPGTVSTLGLPAPYFLKWDDAEYGLRATRSGYSTMVLPGASVTHPSWDAYRTQMSWSARILHRNRLATAAACGSGRGVLAHSLLHQIKHVASGLHLTARLWDAGSQAMLEGPGAWLGTDLPRARADGQEIVEDWRARQEELTRALSPTRRTPLHLAVGAVRAATRLVSPAHAPRIVLELPADEISWRTTLGVDAVIITSREGERIDAFAIDGQDDRALLRRVLGTHLRLALRWGSLRRRYARELPRWTRPEAWQRILGADADADTENDAGTGTGTEADTGTDTGTGTVMDGDR